MPSYNTKTSRCFFYTLSSTSSVSQQREQDVVKSVCPQSVIQLAQQGYTSLDPVLDWLVRVELQSNDEVRGMPGSGQDPFALTCLVEWANIGIRLLYVRFYSFKKTQNNALHSADLLAET